MRTVRATSPTIRAGGLLAAGALLCAAGCADGSAFHGTYAITSVTLNQNDCNLAAAVPAILSHNFFMLAEGTGEGGPTVNYYACQDQVMCPRVSPGTYEVSSDGSLRAETLRPMASGSSCDVSWRITTMTLASDGVRSELRYGPRDVALPKGQPCTAAAIREHVPFVCTGISEVYARRLTR